MHIIIIKSFTEKVIPRGNHIFVKDFMDRMIVKINTKYDVSERNYLTLKKRKNHIIIHFRIE